MKMLLIVRNPVSRVVSDYMLVKHIDGLILPNGTVLGPTIEETLLDEYGNLKIHHMFIHFSSYAKHILNWFKWFPKENFHIMESHELIENPPKLLRRCETFLEVDHKLDKDIFYFNEEKGFYCYWKNNNRTCMPDEKGLKHPEMSENLKTQLVEYFKPLNKVFFNLIGQTYDW